MPHSVYLSGCLQHYQTNKLKESALKPLLNQVFNAELGHWCVYDTFIEYELLFLHLKC